MEKLVNCLLLKIYDEYLIILYTKYFNIIILNNLKLNIN